MSVFQFNDKLLEEILEYAKECGIEENGVVGLAVKNGNAKLFAFSGTPDSNLFSDISKNLSRAWNGTGDKK